VGDRQMWLGKAAMIDSRWRGIKRLRVAETARDA
jgi:hypothetical protein